MVRIRYRSLVVTAALGVLAAVAVRNGDQSEPEPDTTLAGAAVAIDGDTIELAGRRIRLHGIDAPERAQRCRRASGAEWECGRAAAERLSALLRERPARCAGRERDRYGRLVAVCSAAGNDLGAVLVEEGLAHAYSRYSRDYAPLEEAARAAGRGVWQGSAEAPWSFREAARARR
jgi:endonuclease YncB( thermonuclease family)